MVGLWPLDNFHNYLTRLLKLVIFFNSVVPGQSDIFFYDYWLVAFFKLLSYLLSNNPPPQPPGSIGMYKGKGSLHFFFFFSPL